MIAKNCLFDVNLMRFILQNIPKDHFMKNVSKWLLAGSVLALAFSCQPKKVPEASDKNTPPKECEHQSKVEAIVSEPVATVETSVSSEIQTDAVSLSESEALLDVAALEKEEPLPSLTEIEAGSLSIPDLSAKMNETQTVENN